MPLDPIEFDQIDLSGPVSIFTAPVAGVNIEIEHKCLGLIHACNEAERLIGEGENVIKLVVAGHLIDPKHIPELRRYFQG